jgi:hypothetical protein
VGVAVLSPGGVPLPRLEAGPGSRPSHPDQAGGLGFLERLPSAFSLVVLAASAVVAATWAYEEVYHGVAVQSLRVPMVALVALQVAFCLAPLLVFAPVLRRAKRGAILDYGALVARHGRLVHRRWIAGEPVGDEGLLAAPELGPVADTLSLYAAVRDMRIIPIGKPALLAIAIPAILPILVAVGLQIPLKDPLLKIAGALV